MSVVRFLAWVLLAIVMCFYLAMPISLSAQISLALVALAVLSVIYMAGPKPWARQLFVALVSTLIVKYLIWRVTSTLPPFDNAVDFTAAVILFSAEIYSITMLYMTMFVVIDPLELIDEYGADAMRFTLISMAAMGRDIKLATSRVAGYRNFATKLWNAARFGEMNECAPVDGFDPASVSQPLNRWIMGETGRLRAAVDAALQAYRFNDAASALYGDVWGVFCDWYVELSKPLLTGEDAAALIERRMKTLSGGRVFGLEVQD